MKLLDPGTVLFAATFFQSALANENMVLKRSRDTLSEWTGILDNSLEQRRLIGQCSFQETKSKYTVGGRQLKASNTHICNTVPNCKFPAAVNVTEGRSIIPSLERDFFPVIERGVGHAFAESKTYEFKTNFTQGRGTTGYMSFIPTLNCWKGVFYGCFESSDRDVFLLDTEKEYTVCTPALLSGGEIDGTLSFVYVQS